ncbi:MAG: type 4a pilus biogenesis protein PilO [Actinobacteria bacterium]|nr:type 4a pilus biogenesis protein PilO [Actinomycetota bacterium]MCL5887338.1 type 4a pilus biogenesis protein PilO [Actinomycetota bacterium]
MKLTPKQKLLAIVVGMVLVAVLIVALLVVPQFTRLAEIESQVQAAQGEADAARLLLEQRQEIKAQSAQTETQLLRLSNQLPASPELPAFIIELQDVINESGLEFSMLSPTLPVDGGLGFSTIGISVTIRGEWADIIDLTQRLRRVVRQVRIVSFDVTPYAEPATEATPTPGAPAPEQEVDVTMQLEIYSLAPTPPAAEAPPAEVPAQ